MPKLFKKNKKIEIKPATYDDWRFVLHLRNRNYVRNASWDTKSIDAETHRQWFMNNYRYYYIINKNQGVVRVKDGEISIFLYKKYQNRGLGSLVLSEFLKKYKHLKATVRIENTQSLKCFIKSGFVPIGFVLAEKPEMKYI